jgi:hypothetical protein
MKKTVGIMVLVLMLALITDPCYAMEFKGMKAFETRFGASIPTKNFGGTVHVNTNYRSAFTIGGTFFSGISKNMVLEGNVYYTHFFHTYNTAGYSDQYFIETGIGIRYFITKEPVLPYAKVGVNWIYLNRSGAPNADAFSPYAGAGTMIMLNPRTFFDASIQYNAPDFYGPSDYFSVTTGFGVFF